MDYIVCQPNRDFNLHPNAFREDGRKRLVKKFPTSYQEWYSSDEIKKKVPLYLKKEATNNLMVSRLSKITYYVMQYNYNLASYVQECPAKFDKETQDYYRQRPVLCWTQEKIFQRIFFENLNLLVGIIDLEGKIRKYSSFNETLTCADESLPQHYGIPTAALDWTYDPYISIYFALSKIPQNATHFSIYAYKEINSSKNNPIIIKQGHTDIENPRIKVQKGIFTCFQYPCSFYFFNGYWPAIENYIPISSGNLKLIKYDIPIHYTVYFKEILAQNNINEETLLLNSDRYPCPLLLSLSSSF